MKVGNESVVIDSSHRVIHKTCNLSMGFCKIFDSHDEQLTVECIEVEEDRLCLRGGVGGNEGEPEPRVRLKTGWMTRTAA